MSESLDPGITLSELVLSEGASVRLTNCVQRSALADLTVLQAFEMGPTLDTVCLRVPAMGVRSLRELQHLLARFVAQCRLPIATTAGSLNSSQGGAEKGADEQNLFQQVSRLFSEVSLAETVETAGASVRLANGVERAPFRSRSLGELLVEWKQTCADLLRIKNFGRRSLGELREICAGLVDNYFSIHELPPHDSSLVCALLLDGERGNDARHAAIAERLARLPVFQFDALKSSDIRSPEVMAETLLEELDERSRDILRRRYGLCGDVPETLEQIAERYGRTRERIRQLESKALKKMALKGTQLPLRDSLIGHGHEIWKGLAFENDFVRFADLSYRPAIIPAAWILKDVLGISTADLLDQIATRWLNGWCRQGICTTALDQATAELGEVLRDKPLPRPLPELSAAAGGEITRIASELGLGLRTYRGYVLSREISARSQIRLVNLHRQMSNDCLVHGAAELATALGSDNGGGGTSARYVTRVMARYPHLFLEADDGQWVGIGAPAEDNTENASLLTEFESTNEETDDEAVTTAALLREIFHEQGPIRLSRLVEIASGRISPERSAASIGPTLIMSPELFVRVLPGVYGLRSMLPSAEALVEQKPEYLLNADQARFYALARRAGEPWGTFPLWLPAAEAALCRWARRNADAPVLQSLLSVATFDAWPVDEVTKQEWKDFAQKQGARFLLHFLPREGVGYALPKLDRLLAACLETRSNGRFNWMAANRILKRPVYSHLSAGLMALMCSLDALEIGQDTHWQLPHSCGHNLDQLILLLSVELHDCGRLDWNSPMGTHILEQAGDAIGRGSGWVDRNLLATMLSTASRAGRSGATQVSDFTAKAIDAELSGLQWTTAEEALPPSRPLEGRDLAGYAALEVTASRLVSDDEGEWSFEDDFTD